VANVEYQDFQITALTIFFNNPIPDLMDWDGKTNDGGMLLRKKAKGGPERQGPQERR
jgi:hypothetical protein